MYNILPSSENSSNIKTHCVFFISFSEICLTCIGNETKDFNTCMETAEVKRFNVIAHSILGPSLINW